MSYHKRKSSWLYSRFYPSEQLGFTLLEKMILVVVIGIFAAMALPSFNRLFNRMKLDQAVVDVKSALNETQQAAIQGDKACVVTLDMVEGQVTGDCLTGGNRTLPPEVSIATNMIDFISTESSENPVVTASDVLPNWGLQDGDTANLVAFTPTRSSAARMEIYIISSSTPNCSGWRKILPWCWGSGNNNQPPPDTSTTVIPVAFGALGTPTFAVATNASSPADPSGKIVLHLPEATDIKKKCVAISNTLGLMRVGNYEGTTTPADITDSGTCMAADWQAQ